MYKTAAMAFITIVFCSSIATAGTGKLYAGTHDGVAVADTATFDAWGVIKTGGSSIGIKATPDDKYLLVAVYEEKAVRVIDTATDKVVRNIELATRPNAVDITEDGKYIVVACMGREDGDGEDTVSIIDAMNFTETARIKDAPQVNDIKISPEGYACLVTPDGIMQLLDIAGRKITRDISIPKGVYQATFSKDGDILYLNSQTDLEVAVMDMKKYEIVKRIKPGGTGRGLAISPDGKEVWFGSPSGRITVYSTATGKTETIERGSDWDFYIEFSRDMKYAFIGGCGPEGNKIYVYDAIKKVKTGEITFKEVPGRIVFIER